MYTFICGICLVVCGIVVFVTTFYVTDIKCLRHFRDNLSLKHFYPEKNYKGNVHIFDEETRIKRY